MSRIGRWIVIAVGSIVLLLAGAATAVMTVPALQDRVTGAIAASGLSISYGRLLGNDRMSVLLCGTASPFPAPDRADACTAVIVDGKILIFDAGPGMWRNLGLWRLPMQKIAGVFLTHYHSDHIGDLGELNMQTWAAGRPGPLMIHGGPGIEDVVAGFTLAFGHDTHHRTDHHGATLMNPDTGRMIAVPIEGLAGVPDRPETPVPVWREGDIVVTAFTVNHGPIHPALGYRIDYRGRSVVISGDTIPTPHLAAAAKGADVLVMEAQANHMLEIIEATARAKGMRVAQFVHDVQNYHSTPVQAAELANGANVGLLAMTHLTPPPSNILQRRIFVRGVAAVRSAGWVLGHDGLLIELPVGSSVIERREITDARD